MVRVHQSGYQTTPIPVPWRQHRRRTILEFAADELLVAWCLLPLAVGFVALLCGKDLNIEWRAACGMMLVAFGNEIAAWQAGYSLFALLPLKEENQHKDSYQRLIRGHCESSWSPNLTDWYLHWHTRPICCCRWCLSTMFLVITSSVALLHCFVTACKVGMFFVCFLLQSIGLIGWDNLQVLSQ